LRRGKFVRTHYFLSHNTLFFKRYRVVRHVRNTIFFRKNNVLCQKKIRWQIHATIPKEAEHPPTFSAHVHCGQTVGWIKMPLGTEVRLGRGDSVLDVSAPPQKAHSSPPFSAMSIMAKCSPTSATTQFMFCY